MLNWKTKKPILFKVTEPNSIPYRTHPACAKMASYTLTEGCRPLIISVSEDPDRNVLPIFIFPFVFDPAHTFSGWYKFCTALFVFRNQCSLIGTSSVGCQRARQLDASTNLPACTAENGEGMPDTHHLIYRLDNEHLHRTGVSVTQARVRLRLSGSSSE